MSKAQWVEANLSSREVYAGIILGKGNKRDYHLILLPGEAKKVTWAKAGEWAIRVGGELPTRREQSLLIANCKKHFKAAWYWSGEQLDFDAGFAWHQGFCNGGQGYSHVSFEGHAHAVRRVVIED